MPQLSPSQPNYFKATKTFLELFWKATFAPSDSYTGWSLNDRDPQVITQLMPFYSWFYDNYFRVKSDGWEHVPATGKLLMVGSHNGGLAAPDTVMVAFDWLRRFGVNRPAYALMEPLSWQVSPAVARLAAQVGAVQANSSMAISALRQDAAVLIYPGGLQDVFRPYALRQQIYFHDSKGFIKLALLESAPIVPVVSHGAHSSLMVLADFYPQLQWLHQQGMPWPFGIDPLTFPIYLGLPWGLAVGPWPNIPLPVQIHIRVCPPVVFERYGREAAHDERYIDACYQHVCNLMQSELDQLFAEEEAA